MGEEEAPKVDNRWDYSVNKWAAEEELRNFCNQTGHIYTIIRPSITYGNTRIPYGITPPYGKHGTMIKRILNDKPLIRWNKGQNKYNMMRVEDFARAFVWLIGNPKAYNETFNICSEKAYSFNDVLNALEKIINKPISIVDLSAEEYASEIPKRKGEILAGRGMDRISSIKKLKKLYPDFKEQYTLETGIGKTVDAYFKQNWMDGISYEFDGECDRIANKFTANKYNFINYLDNATFKDRLTYYVNVHKGRIDSELIAFSIKVINKIKRLLSK